MPGDPENDTCWAKPFVTSWAEQPPFRISPENPYRKRVLPLYCRAVERFEGKLLPCTLDFHTNMDLFLSVRGDETLCFGLMDEFG